MVTHSSTLAQKTPWTEDPGAGYCLWGRTESDTTERLHFTYYIWKKYFGLKIERPDSNSKIVFLFYIFW